MENSKFICIIHNSFLDHIQTWNIFGIRGRIEILHFEWISLSRILRFWSEMKIWLHVLKIGETMMIKHWKIIWIVLDVDLHIISCFQQTNLFVQPKKRSRSPCSIQIEAGWENSILHVDLSRRQNSIISKTNLRQKKTEYLECNLDLKLITKKLCNMNKSMLR